MPLLGSWAARNLQKASLGLVQACPSAPALPGTSAHQVALSPLLIGQTIPSPNSSMTIKDFPVSTAVGTRRCLSNDQHFAGPHCSVCHDGRQPPCVTWAGVECSWQGHTWILSFSHDGSSGLGASLGFAGPEPACFCTVDSVSSHILPPDAWYMDTNITYKAWRADM